MWTHFWDMNSGGPAKEKQEHIFIEAPEAEAKVIFYNRFGHSPDRISCTCCGRDYSVSSEPDLAQLTAYHRGCRYAYFDTKGREVPKESAWVVGKGKRRGYTGRYLEERRGMSHAPYTTLEEFAKRKDILIIPASEIKAEERVGTVPEQGYVWMD